jgi:uroporphyrinogen-III synthase
MPRNNLNILSTRPLDARIIHEAAEKGVSIDCISFIETQPTVPEDVQLLLPELAQKQLTAVFTSMNAVEAIKAYTGNDIKWKIFSIGSATSKLIEDTWGADKVAGTAGYADDLADEIINSGVSEVVFFCGEQRRDVLPLKLKSNGIIVKEYVVYRTIFLSYEIKKNYDGILFFSPSAVNSFFSANTPGAGAVTFAIGHTTASALQEKGVRNVQVGDSPGKEELVRKMLAYFQLNGRI